MFKVIKASRIFVLPVFISLFFFQNSIASIDSKDVIIEISDKYNQVRLGITHNIVYMILDKSIVENVNDQFENQYKREMQFFADSDGNFIPRTQSYLKSNSIEIPLNEIQGITFEKGKLDFQYYSSQEILFEDVTLDNGHTALDGFYIEDLEQFYLTLNSFTQS